MPVSVARSTMPAVGSVPRAATRALAPSVFHALRCAMPVSRRRAASMNGLSTARGGSSSSFTWTLPSAR
jgi:hypothetical protein